jgi:hypothetical protein
MHVVHVRDDIQKFYAKHGYKPTVRCKDCALLAAAAGCFDAWQL